MRQDRTVPAAQVSDQAKRELTFEKKHLVACALLVEEREPRAAAECELARKTALQPQRDRRMLKHERAERIEAWRCARRPRRCTGRS